MTSTTKPSPFLGPRSVIYPTSDITTSKAWYSKVLGVEPYFDQPGYAGFNVNGFELGLFPAGDPKRGPMTYWGVLDIESSLSDLIDHGATVLEPVHDVGGGIRMANVLDPEGHPFGLIENPNTTSPPD